MENISILNLLFDEKMKNISKKSETISDRENVNVQSNKAATVTEKVAVAIGK
jgi:hypothetical protein